MPDPVLFVKAVVAAAVASALCVLAIGSWRRAAAPVRQSLAHSTGLAVGAAVGFYIFGITPDCSLGAVVDRFLLILLPAAIALELLAVVPREPLWVSWGLRVALAAVAGRILLHGSSYLSGQVSDWTVGQVSFGLALSSGVLIGEWVLLSWLFQRHETLSIPLAVAETCLGAGLAVMISAYLTGGQIGLSLSAALVAVVVVAWLLGSVPASAGAMRIGLVGLYGIVMMARFFGDISTPRALALGLAPVLCLAGDLPGIRQRRPWVRGIVRLTAVAIPLAIVLILAKQDFDRSMLPEY